MNLRHHEFAHYSETGHTGMQHLIERCPEATKFVGVLDQVLSTSSYLTVVMTLQLLGGKLDCKMLPVCNQSSTALSGLWSVKPVSTWPVSASASKIYILDPIEISLEAIEAWGFWYNDTTT